MRGVREWGGVALEEMTWEMEKKVQFDSGNYGEGHQGQMQKLERDSAPSSNLGTDQMGTRKSPGH